MLWAYIDFLSSAFVSFFFPFKAPWIGTLESVFIYGSCTQEKEKKNDANCIATEKKLYINKPTIHAPLAYISHTQKAAKNNEHRIIKNG